MGNAFIFKSEKKNEKSQIFVFTPLHIGALYTKTLDRASKVLEF